MPLDWFTRVTSGFWTGEWDLWAEDEGVTELAVTAADDRGDSTTARATVLVRNSGIEVEIHQPAFDEEVAGTVDVVATVTPDDRFDLSEVVLYGLENDLGEVAEEWGIQRSEPVFTDQGELLEPGDPGYERERLDHYRMMVDACYRNGCAGNNVWMFADWADDDLNVNLYRPGPDAERDAELVAELARWSELLATGEAPDLAQPGCEASSGGGSRTVSGSTTPGALTRARTDRW